MLRGSRSTWGWVEPIFILFVVSGKRLTQDNREEVDGEVPGQICLIVFSRAWPRHCPALHGAPPAAHWRWRRSIKSVIMDGCIQFDTFCVFVKVVVCQSRFTPCYLIRSITFLCKNKRKKKLNKTLSCLDKSRTLTIKKGKKTSAKYKTKRKQWVREMSKIKKTITAVPRWEELAVIVSGDLLSIRDLAPLWTASFFFFLYFGDLTSQHRARHSHVMC